MAERAHGVGGWREETSQDLSDAASKLGSVISGPPGELAGERLRLAWLAYVDVEKSIAFIRADIDEENPGRIVKLRGYVVPDDRQALQFALRYLKKGADDFALGDFRQALKGLRESRNYLRALIRKKRLERARKSRLR